MRYWGQGRCFNFTVMVVIVAGEMWTALPTFDFTALKRKQVQLGPKLVLIEQGKERGVTADFTLVDKALLHPCCAGRFRQPAAGFRWIPPPPALAPPSPCQPVVA